MANTFFSVIIPSFNSGKSILACLRSLELQIDQDFEVILIDDCSTDNSFEMANEKIIKTFSYYRVLQNKENYGVSHTRNLGINNANGEYLVFLDSDDTFHPEKLAILREVFINKYIQFLFHPYTYSDFSGVEVKKIQKINKNSLKIRNQIQTSCVAIKKSSIKFFDTSMSHCEDYDLWLRLSKHMDIYKLNRPLTRLGRPQLTEGGLSGNVKAMRKGEREALRNNFSGIELLVLLLFSYLKKFRRMVFKHVE